MTGKDLAKYRKAARLTQEEFAERIGLNRGSLSRIEGSEDPVSKSIMHRINLAFQPGRERSDSKYLINYYDIEATATPMEISALSIIELDWNARATDFSIRISSSLNRRGDKRMSFIVELCFNNLTTKEGVNGMIII
jgi:transcriptional regulator with XRE-family HTH domain